MNNISTPKVLEAWITPDPSEAVRIDFDQLIANVEYVVNLKFGSQKLKKHGWNRYYNRATQLNTISLNDAYVLMKNENLEAIYFIMPDIRVLLSNKDRFIQLMHYMDSGQFKNSYIVTYYRHFSMQQLWTLFVNYKTVLRYSGQDLLRLRNGNTSEKNHFKLFRHDVIHLSETLLEDQIENEIDFEDYGYSPINHYFYIHELIALKKDFLTAMKSGGKNYVR